MRSKDAEAWIRENLPPHTNPESLSGCSPLPPPPGKVAVPHPDAVNREASNAVSTLSIPLLQGDAHQPTFSQIASVTSEFFPSTMPLPSPSRSSRTPDDRSTDCTTSHSSADEIPLPCPIRLYINGFSQDIPFDILRNFSVSLGVRLFDTCLVRGNNRNALICTVRSKACFDSLIKIVEKPQDPTVRVRLALPRNPQLPHHHVLVRGLTQNTSIESLADWATRSRCAPFETQVGYLGEERVGIFRVETAWGANEAARLLAEPSINHPPLKTFWGKGPGPSNLSAVPFPPPFTLPRQPTPTAIAKHSYHRSATLVTFVHPSRRLPSVTPSLSPGPTYARSRLSVSSQTLRILHRAVRRLSLIPFPHIALPTKNRKKLQSPHRTRNTKTNHRNLLLLLLHPSQTSSTSLPPLPNLFLSPFPTQVSSPLQSWKRLLPFPVSLPIDSHLILTFHRARSTLGLHLDLRLVNSNSLLSSKSVLARGISIFKDRFYSRQLGRNRGTYRHEKGPENE